MNSDSHTLTLSAYFFAPKYFSVELDSKLSVLYSQYFKSILFEMSVLVSLFSFP